MPHSRPQFAARFLICSLPKLLEEKTAAPRPERHSPDIALSKFPHWLVPCHNKQAPALWAQKAERIFQTEHPPTNTFEFEQRMRLHLALPWTIFFD
jgi:hypothetical protein